MSMSFEFVLGDGVLSYVYYMDYQLECELVS